MRRSLSLLLMASAALAGPAASRQDAAPAEVARLQSEQRDAEVRARTLKADAAEARAELAELTRRQAALAAAIEDEGGRLAAQRARLNALNAREAELAARVARARGDQARVLASLTRLSRDPPPPLLVPADQALDAARAAMLLKAMAPELARRSRAETARQAELARLRREAALASAELFAADSRRTDARAELEARAAARRSRAATLEAEAAEAERLSRALEARLRALGARTLPAETSEPSQRLPAGRERLVRPIDAAPSARFDARSPGWRWAADGAPVASPAPGVVAFVGEVEGVGPVMVLDLGPGWRAVLAGVTDPAVAEGARVQAGQPLGRAAGELAFELRRDERAIDPAPWLE